MTVNEIQAHNTGVRRVLDLAEQSAHILETEAGTGTARDQAMTEALRTLAREGKGLLIPVPVIDVDDEED